MGLPDSRQRRIISRQVAGEGNPLYWQSASGRTGKYEDRVIVFRRGLPMRLISPISLLFTVVLFKPVDISNSCGGTGSRSFSAPLLKVSQYSIMPLHLPAPY
ncbi:hypothetical protein D3C76_1659410 [compost metagenome]